MRYNKFVNLIRKNWLYAALIIFLMVAPIFSLSAQEVTTCDPGKLCNPIKIDTVNGLIKTILEGVIKIGIPIIALAIIYSGFLFVQARGNSEALSEAKRTLTYTLIGAAIILGAWAIAQMIVDTVKTLS